MNSLETLYFPDTAIVSTRQATLALLFPKIYVVQPVEAIMPENPDSMDTFMSSPFCQALPLHPLGEDRERFLYLINDIKNRKDDYAAQLSHVTLASMSETKSKGGEARHQILSTLLGRTPQNSAQSDDAEKDKLWQARLVLKIAEILDREEEEVAQALLHLEESEDTIFSQLKGENDKESENLYTNMTKITAKLRKPQIQSITRRTQAWFRFTSDTTLPSCSFWSTTRQEVADILFENHEKIHKNEPHQIGAVNLPVHLGQDITCILEDLQKFHNACKDIQPALLNKLVSASTFLEEDKEFQELHSNWHQLLDMHYPVEKYGRKFSHFYQFKSPLPNFSGLSSEKKQAGPTLLCVCSA